MDVFAKAWNSYRAVLSVVALRADLFRWEIRLVLLEEQGRGHVVAEGLNSLSFDMAADDGMRAMAVFNDDGSGALEVGPEAFVEKRSTLH